MSISKLLKFLLGFIAVAIAIIGALFVAYDEAPPKGILPQKADVLAQEMLAACNVDQWNNTGYVSFSFAHSHHFVWDRKRSFVKVSWNEAEVLLDLNKLHRSIAYKEGKMLEGAEKTALVDEALSIFYNDSFWLVAHYKVFDDGTERYVLAEENDSMLVVKYNSGGVTPGDTYLWKLDQNKRPKSFKLWVQIIPIGGLEASWSSLAPTETGAWMPSEHQFGFINIGIDHLVTAGHWSDQNTEDPFLELR